MARAVRSKKKPVAASSQPKRQYRKKQKTENVQDGFLSAQSAEFKKTGYLNIAEIIVTHDNKPRGHVNFDLVRADKL
jgi:hypothetical protein